MSNIGTSADKDFRTPLKRARNIGSGKTGTSHWWWQRMTAVLLALLAPWLVGLLVSFVGVDAETVRMTVARPWNAIAFAAFAIAAFWHAKLGVQVVLEDYVHTRWMEIALQLLVTFACAIGAIASLYAIARIALTAP
ncbi:MAG: succinate dehydrogenase, hydrophobic membrane anchor protein [Lysobacter sp.]|nr:succinate dehydrogenase, hydrophobic membrane anchor protein [Lysobacter sp.]